MAVVIAGSLIECFYSWETESWSSRLTKVGRYPLVPMSDMPRMVSPLVLGVGRPRGARLKERLNVLS